MIYLASDQYGYEVKKQVADWLQSKNIAFETFGSESETDEKSIADFIPDVAKKVISNATNRGIMICGTGIGVDIGANRFKGIRSVLASNPTLAEWSRTYDNSNVLCLSGWEADRQNIENILEKWFNTDFVDTDGSKKAFLTAMDLWT